MDDLWLAGATGGETQTGRTGAVRWWQRGGWLAAAVDLPEADDGEGMQALAGQAYDELFAVLQARGLRPVRAVQRISATNLGQRDAELLGVTPGVAGLKIERLSYLPSGKVIEFTRSLYRGDAYDFSV